MAGRHRSERRAAPILMVVFVLAVTTLAGGAYLVLDRLGDDEVPAATGPFQPSLRPAPGPSLTPSLQPSPTEPARGRLVIHGTGDVNFDTSYVPALAANGHDWAWSGLDGLFQRDDLTVVNLECPASDEGTIIPKEFNFRCDPAGVPAMREAGVEVANQGNNHAYDYGPEALLDSIDTLESAGVEAVGSGANSRRALAPAIFEVKGWTIAVVGLGMVVDPEESVAGADSPGIAAGHDTGAMLQAIRAAEDRADIVIVTIHWGVELDTQPRAEQVALGRDFVDAGADVVFGHHAHRLQPMDVYKGRPIFWGLGNFVWPNFSAEGSTTAVARVEVRPDGRLRGRLLPAFIESPGHPVLTG